MRPVTIGADAFKGGTQAQQLGFQLSAAVEYLSSMTEAGFDAEESARGLSFEFSVGSEYFSEIARLRAARLLWNRVLTAFQVEDFDRARMSIRARTSRWNMTVYDPMVNVLRATTEAMSAAIGGCDSITILPHEWPYKEPEDASIRLARNLQLVLRDEAYLGRVSDPARGSYYVETLTDAIAKAAWSILQRVEAHGGYAKAIGDGSIESELGATALKERADLASRRRVLIGTNQYPNATEHAIDRLIDYQPLRLADRFEHMRLRTERHAKKTGVTPAVQLVKLGDLKMREARANFAQNFLGCAGFQIRSQSFDSAESAADLISSTDTQAAVLCSGDGEYAAIVDAIFPALRECGWQGPVIVAGYPKESIEALESAGVAGFIHLRSPLLDTLSELQDRLGIESLGVD